MKNITNFIALAFSVVWAYQVQANILTKIYCDSDRDEYWEFTRQTELCSDTLEQEAWSFLVRSGDDVYTGYYNLNCQTKQGRAYIYTDNGDSVVYRYETSQFVSPMTWKRLDKNETPFNLYCSIENDGLNEIHDTQFFYERSTGFIRLEQDTSYCLHIMHDRIYNGNPIHIWKCEAGQPNNVWFYNANGEFQLNANKNYCIHKKGTDLPREWDGIHLYECGANVENSVWVKNNLGNFRLSSGQHLCIGRESVFRQPRNGDSIFLTPWCSRIDQ